MPVESGKLKLNLKGGTPWIEKKKKKKKHKAPELAAEPAAEEAGAPGTHAGPTTTSKMLCLDHACLLPNIELEGLAGALV